MTTTPSSPLDAARSGLYRTPDELELLRQAADHVGIAYVEIDLDGVRDKRGFLDACAKALQFPQTFGANWDAFADSVQDLSWHPARGYVIRVRHAVDFERSAVDDHATAVEILRFAAADWKRRGTPFIVLVDEAFSLPVFTA